MRERRMSDGTSFAPETLHLFRDAFDEAWERIADRFSDDEYVQAREQLAETVMSIAREDSADVTRIRDAAIRAMERAYPMHFQSAEPGQSEREG
jgi:predicted metal-binding transcription factor (methanogenesis marker protein 9)